MRSVFAFVLALAVVQLEWIAPDQMSPNRTFGLSRHKSDPLCQSTEYEFRLSVENLSKSFRLLRVEFYPDDPDGFLSGGNSLEIGRFAALALESAFCLQAQGPRHYAVSGYQSENTNTDFDQSFLGIPSEPWGVSNNPRVVSRRPQIEEFFFYCERGRCGHHHYAPTLNAG